MLVPCIPLSLQGYLIIGKDVFGRIEQAGEGSGGVRGAFLASPAQIRLWKSLRRSDLGCRWFNIDPLLPPARSGCSLTLWGGRGLGPGPTYCFWLLWGGGRPARIEPFVSSLHGKLRAGATFPFPTHACPLPAPAPRQLPRASGLGEEGEVYVLVCCEGERLGGCGLVYCCFGLGCFFGVLFVVFWVFFLARASGKRRDICLQSSTTPI